MPVKINCRRDLRLPDDLYRQPCQCPLCQGAIEVRWPRAAAARSDERRPCPRCGQSIMARAVKCRHCLQWLETT